MTETRMFDAIAHIDEDIVDYCVISTRNYLAKNSERKSRARRTLFVSVAACLGIACAVIIVPFAFNKPSSVTPHPDPIVGNALMPNQIPLEWYDTAGCIEAFAFRQDGSKYRLELKDRTAIAELSVIFENYNWTFNVSKPSIEGFRSDGDVILRCEDMQLSLWYGMDYVRYKNGDEEKWFLSSSPEGQQYENIAEALEIVLRSYCND
ncbi:MAG: hypothetical protein K6G56_05675 [Clostridiales bacterium]|nr:hypothetical protein [Clostridiales bacterium]